MSLRCYMLELMMVTDEEEIRNNFTECIFFFTEQPEEESVSHLYKNQSLSEKNLLIQKNFSVSALFKKTKQNKNKRHFMICFEMMFVSFES